jgi:hypothetical protein
MINGTFLVLHKPNIRDHSLWKSSEKGVIPSNRDLPENGVQLQRVPVPGLIPLCDLELFI